MQQVLSDIDATLNAKSEKYIEIEQLLQECTRLGCTEAMKTCQKLLDDMSTARRCSCIQTLNEVVSYSRYDRGYGGFCCFQGYAPSSLRMHLCEKPSMANKETFLNEYGAPSSNCLETAQEAAARREATRLQSTPKWCRKLARCAAARNPQCCCQKQHRLKSDTAKNPRRWIVKRILLAIQKIVKLLNPHDDINLFPIEPIAMPENSDGRGNDSQGLKVEPFAASRYRLPAGDQFRLTRHRDRFCSQGANLFTVRAQYNCFCCLVHENYGSVQLRQLYCAPLQQSCQNFDKYAALTDGATFRFVRARFEQRRESPREEFAHFDIATELSDILAFGANLVTAAASASASASALSSASPHPSHSFPSLSPSLHSTIENVLAFAESNVIKLRHENGCSFVLKYFNKGFMDDAEPSVHFTTEIATIRSLASNAESFYNKPSLCDSIVKQNLIDSNKGTFLVSEYSGESLFSFCFCNNVQLWKEIVRNSIANALNHLHSLGFAFVDLHPGNIVCRDLEKGEKSAKLIDLESVTPLTQKRVTCRVMNEFMAPGPLVPSITNDFASLKLVLAWMDNTHNYRQIAYNSDYFSTEQHDAIKWKIINNE